MSKPFDPKAIFSALYGVFNGNTALKTAVNFTSTYPGFYIYQPPLNAPYPHIVVTLIGNAPYDTIGSTSTAGEKTVVQLTCFSNKHPDNTEVLAVQKAMTTAFDEAVLTFTAGYYGSIRTNRIADNFVAQPEVKLFLASSKYELMLVKI